MGKWTRGSIPTYRQGEFWIGRKHIERYRPKDRHYPGEGIFMNRDTGDFEFWKDAELISKRSWLGDHLEIVDWARKQGFDYDTTKNGEKTENDTRREGGLLQKA